MQLEDLFESTQMLEIASGLQFTEGPLWHPDGYLLFSDIPAATIYRLVPGSKPQPWREHSGNSNGLTYDRQGYLIACEHGNRRVSRTDAAGTVSPIATHFEGKRLNSPNDVVVRSDGSIYFTDPPYGIKPEEQEVPCNGLYRLAADGTLYLLDGDFERCNGLAFSPDETTLYVDDTWRRHIKAYDVARDGGLSNMRLFCEMISEAQGGPDGMKVDQQGNLYSTGPGGIWVFEPSGELVGIISGPQLPANLAFGGDDLCTLYVTARTSLYTLRTRVPGVPVF